MRVLFLGGTGTISSACSQRALARGITLTHLNRGLREPIEGVEQLSADLNDSDAVRSLVGGRDWDAVVDFIAFSPAQVEQRIELLRGRIGHYLFISSASVYQKPPTHYLHTESTPLANPFWAYSRNKIACEERLLAALRDERFPATIVRPSYTYGEKNLPLAYNSSARPYTVVDRMRRGLPVIVPGDGTSLWTMTHNSDLAVGLVGLLGHQQAVGHAFHITADEVLSWNQIYEALAQAAGVAQPELVHIAADFIAACVPDDAAGLAGDKSHSAVFDNSKIKAFVPEFGACVRFADGIRRSVRWFDADPARRLVDDTSNHKHDRLIAAYRRGLQAAMTEFGRA